MRVPTLEEQRFMLSCRNVGGPGGHARLGGPEEMMFRRLERLGWMTELPAPAHLAMRAGTTRAGLMAIRYARLAESGATVLSEIATGGT